MGYELTAHLDLSIEEPVAFIERWTGLMATEDVTRIELSQKAPGICLPGPGGIASPDLDDRITRSG
jgi:hypothetical protein